ncbi:MAG: HPr family phosphocarrier protein [Lachnospiraceae bacterium]|nr:HPr family phosphocarrier protein [Lachnospiraceae bacterium]
MMERRIKLAPDEVAHFVEAARKCDFDIDIAYNRYTVDAKSILGVLALDLGRMLTVSYDGYNKEFEEVLQNLAMAC